MNKLSDQPIMVQSAPGSDSLQNALPTPTKMDDKSSDSVKPKSAQVKGAITSINSSTIMVNGRKAIIAPKTQVQGNLEVGAIAQAEGLDQHGNILAKQVLVLKLVDSKVAITKSPDDQSNVRLKGKSFDVRKDDSKKEDAKKDDSKQNDPKGDSGKSGAEKSNDSKGKDGGSDDGADQH